MGVRPRRIKQAPQAFPAADQPGLDRPDRAVQSPRGLLVGQPLEVAEDQRQPVLLRQPVEFLVELRPGLGGRSCGRCVSPPFLHPCAPAARRRAASARDFAATRPSDAEQPARDRIGLADRGRLAGEDQERRLEGVLGGVLVAQHVAADPEHQRGRAAPPATAKAASATASSLRVAKRSSSCPSVIPPTAPTWNKVWNGLAAADSLSVMETPLDRSRIPTL